MLILNNIGDEDILRKILLGIYFVGSATIIVGAYIIGGINSAVSQIYVPLGFLLAIVFLKFKSKRSFNFQSKIYQFICLSLFFLTLSLSFILESRPLLLLVSFPLGIIAGFFATCREAPRQGILTTIISLVGLQIGNLILLTGIYVGNFDPLWQHYEYVAGVSRIGGLENIPGVYSFYPGLFTFGSIVSSVTGLSFYPASMTLLIIFTSVIVIAWYMILNKWVTKQTSARAVLISATLIPVLFHFMVFFPQNMAFALLFTIFAISSSEKFQLNSFRLTILVMILTAGVIFTHHYSFILLSPLALLLTVIGREGQRKTIKLKLLMLPWISAFSYAVFIGSQFVIAGFYVIISLQEARAQSTGGLYEFGMQLPEGLPYTLTKIVGPFGLHYTLLVAGFVTGSIGVLTKLRQDGTPGKWIGIFVIGGIAGGIMLPGSPTFKTGFRLSYSLAIVFSLVIAVGIQQLPSSSRETIAMVFIASLVITAPIGYAGDVPQINPAQSYSEQRSYTSSQVEQLKSVAKFSRYTNQNDLSSAWLDRELLELYGMSTEELKLSSEGVHIETEFLVTRSGWDDEKVNVEQRPELAWFLVSNSDHNNMLYESNFIYSSGRVFIVSPRNETVYGSKST